MSNYHDQPWAQLLLYEYNLNNDDDQFYEYDELPGTEYVFRFASRPARMNCLVKFDSDGITPPP